MPDFVSGIVLARQFYREAVRPILDEALPGLAHAAGLIGFGSEVLGFDTPVSVDHHWGPRVLLFLGDEDCDRHTDAIRDVMRRRLPTMCLGWSTNFSAPDLNDQGVQTTAAGARGGHQPSGGDPDSIAILPRLPGPRRPGAPHRPGLADAALAEAGHGHSGRAVSRWRRAGRGAATVGLVPPRCLALPDGRRLDADRAGGTSDGAGGPGGRRPGLAGDRRPTGPRSDAAVLSHGAPVRPVREVVRHCFQQAEGRPWPAAAPQPGARRHILGRNATGAWERPTRPWPACTTAWA